MLAYRYNNTMRAVFSIIAVVVAIGVLFYIADFGVSSSAVPSLSEYIASSTALGKIQRSDEENQASVAWLASSTIIDALLPDSYTASSSDSRPISTTKVSKSMSDSPLSYITSVKTVEIPEASSSVQSSPSLLPVKTSKTTIYAFVAKNPTTREKGLSGFPSLGADQGMLFIFPTIDQPAFWMKDMNFPIDVVWMDEYKKIIGITANISPKTYPKTFPAPGEIQFVLEVNAGSAEKLGLTKGTTVVF